MRRSHWILPFAIMALAACRFSTEEPLTAIEQSGFEDPLEGDASVNADPDLSGGEDLDQNGFDPLEEPDLSQPDLPVDLPEETVEDDPVVFDPIEEEPVDERITWIGSVQRIFRNRCVSCHYWCSSYTSVASRCANGSMRRYIQMGHYISGTERQTVLDWIDDGYPQE